MMLLTSRQNLDFSSIYRYSIIAVCHGNPAFTANLDKKGVKRNGFQINQRVTNFVDTRRKNNILATALKTHNCALVHSDYFQISDLTFYNGLIDVFMKTENTL